MLKINNLILISPIFLNILIIYMMMIPSKISKFHPITLMVILIMITFLICLKMNFLKKSMIPFILFLIMIGGLMVIFMYITSLANNELFTFNYKYLLINFMKNFPMMFFLLILIFFFKQLIFTNIIQSFNFFNIKDMYQMNIMYKEYYNKSSFFIMIYLYYSMICIMNICYKLKIPLRQLLF